MMLNQHFAFRWWRTGGGDGGGSGHNISWDDPLLTVQFLVARTRLCHSVGPSFPLQAAFALLPLPNHIPLMLLCIQHPLALPPTTPTSRAPPSPEGGLPAPAQPHVTDVVMYTVPHLPCL